MPNEQKKEGVLFRSINFKRDAIDEDKRTVEIALSSETPVERWGGLEILDHESSSIRTERIKSDGPLLLDHDRSDQVGTVDEITIGADRVGRAVVRFSKSERAQEIFQDVIDGIRKSISVGYRVYKAVLEDENDDKPNIYRVTDWEPFEVSFVSVPADISVGVGRTENAELNEFTITRSASKMPEEKTEAQEPAIDIRLEADTQIKSQREAETKRIRAINAIGSTYKGHNDLMTDAIRTGRSVEDFSTDLADAELKSREKDVPDTHLDLSDNDVRQYSVTRALSAQITGNWKDAELEREMSNEIAERLGVEARGVLVPYDIQQRVITTTGAASGAIGTDHMSGSFIDNLRDQALVMQLGARPLTGLRGNVDIPRKTSSASFTWVGEDGDSIDTDINIGTVSMSPKTVTGSVPISRRTLLQSSPDMDALVMSDLAHGNALAIDIAALTGAAGGDNPIGITATTGVLTNTIAAAGKPTWAEIVNFETLCAAVNSLAGGAAFVTTAAVRGFLKTAKKDAGSGIFLIENNEANGYPVHVKTDSGFPANTMLFGDFSQVIVGMWGVLDLVPDTATKAASGGLVIRSFQDVDVAIRQPSAFVKSA